MTTSPLRLFFALPCPPDLARRITAWRDGLGAAGRPVAAGNLHITLAFLGNQHCGKLTELKVLAGEIAAPAFALTFDHLERWPGGLLHLAPSQPPEALIALQHTLRERLLAHDFVIETRRFHPHLSLARDCEWKPDGLAPVPIFTWQVESFALYISEKYQNGTRYKALEAYRLKE